MKSNNKKLEIGFMRHDPNNPQESQAMVDFAIANGQPYFESCYFYLDNQCEPFIYSLLSKYSRDQYQICGKLPVHSIVETYGVAKIFQEQLERVPGHYFDTYLLQALDSACLITLKEQKIIPYLLEQKKKGKIKKLGISIQCTPETFKKYLDLKC